VREGHTPLVWLVQEHKMNERNYDRSERKINTDQVVNYLNHAFSRAASKASSKLGNRALRTVVDGTVETTALYDYQVEFCYLVDAIQMGSATSKTGGYTQS